VGGSKNDIKQVLRLFEASIKRGLTPPSAPASKSFEDKLSRKKIFTFSMFYVIVLVYFSF